MSDFKMDEHWPNGKFNLHEIEKARIEDGAPYDHCCCYFDDDRPMNLCNHHREPLQEIDRLTAEVSRLTFQRDQARGSVDYYHKHCESLMTEVSQYREALERLASPEAFHLSRATNEEDRARMRFAEAALGPIADGRSEVSDEYRSGYLAAVDSWALDKVHIAEINDDLNNQWSAYEWARTHPVADEPKRCIFCRDVSEPMPAWNGKCPRCSQQIWPPDADGEGQGQTCDFEGKACPNIATAEVRLATNSRWYACCDKHASFARRSGAKFRDMGAAAEQGQKHE